jgi:pimeloyl-ACP methyl ester carboxylesterase
MVASTDVVVAGEGGVDIAFTVSGDGPGVLLIHGFPDDRTLWRVQADALAADGHTVIAVDQRGFGASGKPEDWKAYRAHHAAADMVAVLDHLDLESADVVGHDWGSATASILSMCHPTRVQRLVLMSAGHPSLFHQLGLQQLERAWYMQFFQDVDVAAEWLCADDWANFRMWGRHPNEDEAIERLSQPGALVAALNWYRANSKPATLLKPKREVPRFSHSTLGIWGANDDHLVEDFVTQTDSYTDGEWRYVRIEGAGHWIQIDQPDALAELLVSHLAT